MNLRAAMGSASTTPGDTMEKTTVATCLTRLVNVSAEFTYFIAHRSYVFCNARVRVCACARVRVCARAHT